MLASLFTLLAGVALSTPAGARADQGGGNDREHKVTLCHATHSFTNPYVKITVDYHAVIHAGHGGHEGPIFTPTIDPHEKWGDIIPPFDFGGAAVYAGMNWTAEGQAILAADCELAAPPTTTVPTTVAPTTTAAPTTTTAAPTTTTTEQATTTTAAPESTTTTEESTTTSTAQVLGVTVSRDGTTTTVARAPNATPPVRVLGAEVERTPAPTSGNLPLTGASTGPLVLLALGLIGAGLAMLRSRRHAAAA